MTRLTEKLTAEQAAVVAAVEAAGDYRTAVRGMVNRVADRAGLPHPWPGVPVDGLPDLADVEELGVLHQTMLARAEAGRTGSRDMRHEKGAYYTPVPAAEALVRLSVVPQLDQRVTPDNPWGALDVACFDPACGAGVLLVAAVDAIADRFARVLFRTLLDGNPALLAEAVRSVLPDVITECAFGADLDPVAVDLSKSALWIHAEGRIPMDRLDPNFYTGSVLDGPDAEPPALAKKFSRTPAATG